MFDFQKLIVYQKAKVIHRELSLNILNNLNSKTLKDQLSRASISIVLNIAEGTSRISKADLKNF